jgi:hypothetical protein
LAEYAFYLTLYPEFLGMKSRLVLKISKIGKSLASRCVDLREVYGFPKHYVYLLLVLASDTAHIQHGSLR